MKYIIFITYKRLVWVCVCASACARVLYNERGPLMAHKMDT